MPLRSKLDSGVDAAALAWSLGYINYKPDAATAKVRAESSVQVVNWGTTLPVFNLALRRE